MDSKKLLGLLLTLGGAIALGYGVIMLTSGNIAGPVWAAAILGAVFFLSGIGLMKSVKSGSGGSAEG